MLKIIHFIYKLFSIYECRLEKSIDIFLSGLSESSNRIKLKESILNFIKEDLIVFNIWLERKYKGYKYLNKKNRRTLYINANKIKERFKNYCNMLRVDFDFMKNEFIKQNVDIRFLKGNEKEFRYLYKINQFFNNHVKYKYQEASNLGELLKDPENEILKGDCNQIVTMYIYLFGLKYDISKLQLKVFDEHICLHFCGVDIEGTRGAFVLYDKKDMSILPVEEIISVNLLDVSDSRKKHIKISPKLILESSKLAFLLSSNREIVQKNLSIAYKNICIEYSKNNNHKLALKYSKYTDDAEFRKKIITNTCYFYLKRNNFKASYKLANIIKDQVIIKNIQKTEGYYKYKKGNLDGALAIFKKNGDKKMIEGCYEAMYMKERQKIKNLKTVSEFKKNKKTLKEMLDLSLKSGNSNLVRYVKSILKQIN